MKNHLNIEELALYAEYLQKGRPQDCPTGIRHHVENCNQCATEAAELALIIDNTSIKKNKLTLEKNNPRLIYFITASAAVLIILTSLWFVFDAGRNNKDIQIAKSEIIIQESRIPSDNTVTKKMLQAFVSKKNDSAKENINPGNPNTPQSEHTNTEPKNLYAEAFIPNELSEKLVTNYEGHMRANGPSVTSSNRMEVKAGTEIVLKWKNPDKINLYIEIYDNKAIAKETRETADNSIIVNSISTPGIYYWKLFNDDYDLIFCGSITVRDK